MYFSNQNAKQTLNLLFPRKIHLLLCQNGLEITPRQVYIEYSYYATSCGASCHLLFTKQIGGLICLNHNSQNFRIFRMKLKILFNKIKHQRVPFLGYS